MAEVFWLQPTITVHAETLDLPCITHRTFCAVTDPGAGMHPANPRFQLYHSISVSIQAHPCASFMMPRALPYAPPAFALCMCSKDYDADL